MGREARSLWLAFDGIRPLRRKVRAVKSPSFTAPFYLRERLFHTLSEALMRRLGRSAYKSESGRLPPRYPLFAQLTGSATSSRSVGPNG